MISNRQIEEASKLQPMNNNDTQNNEESYPEEIVMANNESQHKVLTKGYHQKLIHKYVYHTEFIYNIYLCHYL